MAAREEQVKKNILLSKLIGDIQVQNDLVLDAFNASCKDLATDVEVVIPDSEEDKRMNADRLAAAAKNGHYESLCTLADLFVGMARENEELARKQPRVNQILSFLRLAREGDSAAEAVGERKASLLEISRHQPAKLGKPQENDVASASQSEQKKSPEEVAVLQWISEINQKSPKKLYRLAHEYYKALAYRGVVKAFERLTAFDRDRTMDGATRWKTLQLLCAAGSLQATEGETDKERRAMQLLYLSDECENFTEMFTVLTLIVPYRKALDKNSMRRLESEFVANLESNKKQFNTLLEEASAETASAMLKFLSNTQWFMGLKREVLIIIETDSIMHQLTKEQKINRLSVRLGSGRLATFLMNSIKLGEILEANERSGCASSSQSGHGLFDRKNAGQNTPPSQSSESDDDYSEASTSGYTSHC